MQRAAVGAMPPKAKTPLGRNPAGFINLSTKRRRHYALYTLTE